MPHLVLEFTSNIVEKSNLTSLLKQCHLVLSDMLPTELVSCKSRAVERDIYCIGDGNGNGAFVHVDLRVMPGRDKETLQMVGQRLMDILKAHFSESLKVFQLQITLEINELATTYFKAKS